MCIEQSLLTQLMTIFAFPLTIYVQRDILKIKTLNERSCIWMKSLVAVIRCFYVFWGVLFLAVSKFVYFLQNWNTFFCVTSHMTNKPNIVTGSNHKEDRFEQVCYHMNKPDHFNVNFHSVLTPRLQNCFFDSFAHICNGNAVTNGNSLRNIDAFPSTWLLSVL